MCCRCWSWRTGPVWSDSDHGISLDVAPLLETVDDLKNGPAIMETLLARQ